MQQQRDRYVETYAYCLVICFGTEEQGYSYRECAPGLLEEDDQMTRTFLLFLTAPTLQIREPVLSGVFCLPIIYVAVFLYIVYMFFFFFFFLPGTAMVHTPVQ